MSAKSILSMPWAFSLYQKIIGAPGCHRRFIQQYAKPRPSDRVLDLGCGTGASVRFLPSGVSYVGVDISEEYIQAARASFGECGVFLRADLNSVELDQFAPFDLSISFGVLHHLNDAEVASMLHLARRVVKPGGRLVTIDPCYISNQPKIAKFLNDNDRGRHIRDAEVHRQLFTPHGEVETVVLSDMLRIPYTMIVTTLRIQP